MQNAQEIYWDLYKMDAEKDRKSEGKQMKNLIYWG
jgi:hypothetical protein